MLSILTNKYEEYPQLREITDAIKQIYDHLDNKSYSLIKDLVDNAITICNDVKSQSISSQNEEVANSTFVINGYLRLLNGYATYWKYLQSENYRESWDTLQGCIDNLIITCKFTQNRNTFNLEKWENHLRELEKLYPFKIFASSEMITKDEKCSICGRTITDLNCDHIPGNLYWGKMAHIIIEKDDFIGVALVKHPLDKRCVMELKDDTTPKEEKYKLLHYFVQNNRDPLGLFEIDEVTKLYFNDKTRFYNRNDSCPCGSGKKFKKCCGQNKYEEGIHYNIIMKGRIPTNLVELPKIN